MATQDKPTPEEPGGPAGRLFDNLLAGQVKASAQQIWLAGMGAFARAQQEGGKVFDALVKEGAHLQKRTSEAAEDRFGDMGQRMSEAQARAGQGWDKLEGLFEERLGRALKRVGVPQARELAALADRVEQLEARLARLAKTAPPRKAAAAKPAAPTPARKAAAKRAATRKIVR